MKIIIAAVLVFGACFLIYEKLTAKKPDGNKTRYPWSPPKEPKEEDDLDVR